MSTMSPGLRRLALTTHVTASVGWLGAVVVALSLSVVTMTSQDIGLARAAARSLEMVGWAALIPFSVASLITGLVQSLGSRWGLFRHYWVLVKLVMNVFATTVLLLYMQTLSHLSEVAARPTLTSDDLAILQSPSPAVHGTGALVLLLLAVVVSVYKPPGMTPYGARKHLERRSTARR
ncbi:hypothetical protein [Actinomadura sp. 6N118]|uniref:hypothetical protein n=1 Tax=Actinomadura sp. 6N118 TaxID=3375151 RepID=UPI00378B18F3